LSSNPAAIDLIKENMIIPDRINWNELSANPSPDAIQILKQNPRRINWNRLSANPSAIELLREKAKQDPDSLNWNMLSKNPEAINLLRLNRNKINWDKLSENPGIFDDKYFIARRVISNNLREAIYNPNTPLGYNRIKRNFERENKELYNRHKGIPTAKLYHEVFKSPPPPPKRMKGIFRDSDGDIKDVLEFGKKKRSKLSLKQINSLINYLKKK